MFDMFWWHLDFETLDMPPGYSIGLGKPFCAIAKSFYSISLIFDLVTPNDRCEDSAEDFFSFFSRSVPRGS